MKATELRELQAPLKERFRNEPDSAKETLRAHGIINVDAITVYIDRPHSGPVMAGLHPLAGGDGTWVCSSELLLDALVGCAGVTFAAVCSAMEIPIRSAELQAQGDLDFRGTMGVDRSVPVGFLEIRLKFTLDSEESDEKLAKAVELAERYCVVAQSLKSVSANFVRKQ